MQKPSPVIQANCDLLIKREQVGEKKYGVTLDKAGLTLKQLLQHLLEEQLDGANYIQAMLLKLQNESSFIEKLEHNIQLHHSCRTYSIKTEVLIKMILDHRTREILGTL